MKKKIHSIIDLDSLTTYLVSSIPKLNFIYVAFEMWIFCRIQISVDLHQYHAKFPANYLLNMEETHALFHFRSFCSL